MKPQLYAKLNTRQKRDLRVKYGESQNGLCYHCKNPLKWPPTEAMRIKSINLSLFPKNFLQYPVHLHHSHKTGLTLGAVHARCNAVLWQYHKE